MLIAKPLRLRNNHDDGRTQIVAELVPRVFTFSVAKFETSNPMFPLTLSGSLERISKEFGAPQKHGSKHGLDFCSAETPLNTRQIFSASFYQKKKAWSDIQIENVRYFLN